MLFFLNVFLLPLIALAIRHHRNGTTMRKLDMEIIAEYGILTVILYILCGSLKLFLSETLYIDTSMDSFRYTLIVTAFAVLLPFAEEIIRKSINVHLEIRPRKDVQNTDTEPESAE